MFGVLSHEAPRPPYLFVPKKIADAQMTKKKKTKSAPFLREHSSSTLVVSAPSLSTQHVVPFFPLLPPPSPLLPHDTHRTAGILFCVFVFILGYERFLLRWGQLQEYFIRKSNRIRKVGPVQAATRLTHGLKGVWFQIVKRFNLKPVSNMPCSNSTCATTARRRDSSKRSFIDANTVFLLIN